VYGNEEPRLLALRYFVAPLRAAFGEECIDSNAGNLRSSILEPTLNLAQLLYQFFSLDDRCLNRGRNCGNRDGLTGNCGERAKGRFKIAMELLTVPMNIRGSSGTQNRLFKG